MAGSPEAALEATLRALRRSLAEQGGVPNYVIFADRTLYDLIDRKPASEAELLEVFGMGRIKAARFGPEILDAIRRSGSPSSPAFPGT